MESVLVFWLFMVFIFGAMTLGLFLGYRSIEEKRALEKQDRETQEMLVTQAMATIPRFFASTGPRRPKLQLPVFDDDLLADVESYVRAEQALVNRFVNDPSVDALYRQPRSPQILH